MLTRRSVEAQIEQGLVSAVLPPRTWPIMSFTLLGPLAIGLCLHAVVQVDRWLLLWGIVTGTLALPIGALPARRFREQDALAQDISDRGGGDRRVFIGFLALAIVTLLVWWTKPLRLALGGTSLILGVAFLITLGRSTTTLDGARRLSALLIPWCYALGPAGAVGIARLAVRPTNAQLGDLRDVVYLTLGRIAAMAAIAFWLIVEREIRRRARATGTPAPDTYLPYRLLLFLLALTGFLVPGGGTPFALSWAVAWFIAAWFERRLRVG